MLRILKDTCQRLGLGPVAVFSLAVQYLDNGDENPDETGLLAYRAWSDKIARATAHKAKYLDDYTDEQSMHLPDWVESYCLDVLSGRIKLLEHKGGYKNAS